MAKRPSASASEAQPAAPAALPSLAPHPLLTALARQPAPVLLQVIREMTEFGMAPDHVLARLPGIQRSCEIKRLYEARARATRTESRIFTRIQALLESSR